MSARFMPAVATFMMALLFVAGCKNEETTQDSAKVDPSKTDSAKVDPAQSKTVAKKDDDNDPEHHYFHKQEQPHSAEWGYDGDSGPMHWGDLSKSYTLAKTGKRQSPIDLTGEQAAALPQIEFDYRPSKIDLVYNGHTVEEIEDKASSITVDSKKFVLQQFHFHSPSEHTIDGRHFDMEMHLVHTSDDGKVAVIGVMINAGDDNPAFDTMWDYLPSAANRERKESVTVDASTLLPQNHNYYRYSGSFTTPPCTEEVLWMVLSTPISLSKQQIDRFRMIIQGNNRPVQALNGRLLEITK